MKNNAFEVDLIDYLVKNAPIDNVYAVGGVVRDALLNKPIHDVDLAIKGNSHDWAEQVAPLLDAAVVPVGGNFNVTRLAIDGSIVLDIAGFDNDIEEDLSRRDFTVNALAIPLSKWFDKSAIIGNPIDVLERTLNPVSDSIFKDDGARLLRAIRIAAQHDLNFSNTMNSLMERDYTCLSSASPERIRDEFLRILALPFAHDYIVQLDNLKLLTQIIPELEACRNETQPKKWHMYNVLEHMFKTLWAVEYITDDHGYFGESVGDGHSRRTMLKLAALLHDIGKPQSRIEMDDEIHFYGHEYSGTTIAHKRLSELRLCVQNVSMVTNIIRYHMRPHLLIRDGLNRRNVHRFCRKVKDEVMDVMHLATADKMAHGNLDLDILYDYVKACWKVQRLKDEPVNQPRSSCSFLNGNDIMQEFNLQPGPVIGQIITALMEAEAVGEIDSRDSAIALAAQLLEDQK